MDNKLETLLGNLLVPDSAVTQQATQQLKLVCRDPGIILQLCQVLTSAQDPQVRQYGAVLLRRRITKKKQWTNLPVEFKQHLRSNIIHAVIQENDKSVRDALVEMVGTVAKHELSGEWPELFAFLDEFTKSPDATKWELGLYVLSQVADVANEHLKPHLLSLSQIFEQALLNHENRMCQYYAVLTMTHLVCQIGTDEQGRFQQLITPLLHAIRGLISEDERKARKALKIFDELVESDVAVIVPHVKVIVEFCLEISANQNLGDEIRVKATSFITRLTKLKKKSILKHKLVEPVLEVMFTIMCVPDGEDDDDQQNEDDDGVESSEHYYYACQVINIMALHLPTQKIIPKMMSLVEPALRSSDPHHKKAGYLTLGLIVDGCSETIRNNYLDVCVQCLVQGIQDPNPIVRNSAIFALAQFSEHLQPDISKFANELFPLLLNYLRESHASNTTDPSLSDTYHNLEKFFQNMGKGILPYLAPLMNQILNGLSENNTLKIRELSISTVKYIAKAVKEDLAPYFQSIMRHLRPLLNANCPEEMLPLQIEAFDTLADLATVLEDRHLLPLAHECVQLGIQVMMVAKDPDLRVHVYGLMAVLSQLLEYEMSEFLQPIVDQMMESLKSNEGVTSHINDKQEDWLKLFDAENLCTDDTESDDEEDSKLLCCSDQKAFLQEKRQACTSLGEIAHYCEQTFMPHIDRVYKEMIKMLDHPAAMVRKASGLACAHLCSCLAKSVGNGIQDATPLLFKMIFRVLPKLLTCICEDVDREVVTYTLLAVKVLLDEVKEPVLAYPEHLVAISDCVRCVLSEKTACQDADDDPELDSEESEYDSVLIENAGGIIPALVRVENSENSIFLVTSFLPDLVKRLKKNCSECDRSFGIGTIAEIVNALGEKTEVFVEQLYTVIMHTLQDVDEEVRVNAIYAVGLLAKNGGQKILTKYYEILEILSTILARERDNYCLDNICGAVCRMLLKCPQSLPVDKIVPVVLRNLPLREDFGENSTIFECLNSLYAAGQKDVVQNLSQILSVIARVLADRQDTDDCIDHMERLVKRAGENQPDVVISTLSTLNEKEKEMLEECLGV